MVPHPHGVVHGSDGLDELTTTGHSYVAEIKNGEVREFEITPEEAGLPVAKLDDLLGGTPEENAAAMRRLFDGEKSAYRDVALLNAGASFIVTGQADNLKAGVKLAAQLVDSGKVKEKLAQLIEVSNGVAQS